MLEVLDYLTDEHKQEISNAVKEKILLSIREIDAEELSSPMKDMIIEDFRMCLESNYISDEIEWSKIGDVLMSNLLKQLETKQ